MRPACVFANGPGRDYGAMLGVRPGPKEALACGFTARNAMRLMLHSVGGELLDQAQPFTDPPYPIYHTSMLVEVRDTATMPKGEEEGAPLEENSKPCQLDPSYQ